MVDKSGTETYGVELTPHFEKYQNQNQETADLVQAVWNFGNLLKGQGYKIAYMHGPVGIYEGLLLTTSLIKDISVEKMGLEEFIKIFPDKEKIVYFLYQKLPDAVRLACLEKETIETNRKSKQIKRKSKVKKVVEKTQTTLDKQPTTG